MGDPDPGATFDSPTFDPDAFMASLTYDNPPGDAPAPPVLGEGEEVLVRRTYHLPPTVDARLTAAAQARGLTVEELLGVLADNAA